ncbi:aldo/keto reductase [Sphingobium sp. WW5]
MKIEAICDRHDVPITAAALQFPLAHEVVCSVIPGISSAERLLETVQMLEFPIPEAFWRELRDAALIAPGAPLPLVDR